MATLFWILALLCGLASLGCFVYVLVMMFQHKQVPLAVACIVATPCFVGILLAFIMGWMKASEWGTGLIMIIWSAVAGLGLVFYIVSSVGNAMQI